MSNMNRGTNYEQKMMAESNINMCISAKNISESARRAFATKPYYMTCAQPVKRGEKNGKTL